MEQKYDLGSWREWLRLPTRSGEKFLTCKVQCSRFKERRPGWKWRFEVTMPRCPGYPRPGWIDFHTCFHGQFRWEDTFLEQLTQGTQQSGPIVRSDWKRLLVAVDTHMWHGLDRNAPIAGTELPGYPPFKEKNITGKLSARSRVCE